MKVSPDASVLFSEALPGSRMAEFLRFVGKRAGLVSSPAAVDENLRNLERKVVDAASVIETFQRFLRTVSLTDLVADLPGVELVEKDRHILGAAVAAECSHLLTGDERHFKQLFGKVVEGVKVVHAAMLAKELGLRRSQSAS